jgi:predicted N-acyltransferase
MKIVFTDKLANVNAEDWNRLAGHDNPFIQYEFLNALEQHDCLQNWGWYPQHCLLYADSTDDSADSNGRLIGACPAYIKDNSYGEFVFDWAWADAYQRHGLDYYPKLVTSIPYTPAQGPRLLADSRYTDESGNPVPVEQIKKGLINALLAFADNNRLSSSHFLFCEADDLTCFDESIFMFRTDYQFHWHNHDYTSFDDFLARLNSKRRKNIRRERRIVTENNIRIDIIPGPELTEAQWQTIYRYYCLTFMRKSGAATLTLEFFRAVADRLRAVVAYQHNEMVAAAICFEGSEVLYGRHWGCEDDYDSLHFEVCYYAGIEYCIENQLKKFEPGAQGEHKIWRGFLPCETHSAHWVAHPGFRQAIAEHLQHETAAMLEHGTLLAESSPFRRES